mmetsp:Transcript_4846/g.4043  ORF Transcript_4846/g.4043 Transcript_4846/m.4043 type:complete len:131 (-) Transcript_4846:632-1024(-)
MAEADTKPYPSKQADIDYEKEITDAIKKLPVEQRLQMIAMNKYTLKRKVRDQEDDKKIDASIVKYNNLEDPHLRACNDIIAGERAPLESEIEQFKEHLTEEEKGKVAENLEASPITEYWYKAITQCCKLE